MSRFLILVMMMSVSLASVVLASEKQRRIAIIKADDIRRVSKNWQHFFDISKEKGVKVSAGIICNSLSDANESYVQWLRECKESGNVEFWNHGWDHKRWKQEAGVEIKEFSGSGFAHQKKHYDDSQALMKRVLGVSPVAFGAPYNAMDADCYRVLNADPEMRLVFGYKDNGLKQAILAPMRLRGEHDGTGKPNFKKFKADYEKKSSTEFTAIQFHPNNFRKSHFEEYAKILDFLLEEGWTFMLPSEYVAAQER